MSATSARAPRRSTAWPASPAAGRVAISGETGEPEQVRTIGATTNIFTVLGVPMAAGRNFTDADGTPQPQPPPPPPGAPAAAPAGPPPLPTLAILSHGLWQRRYGSDPNIIGKTIGFGNGRAEVVGVLPANFELLFPPRTGIEPNIDVWTAMRLNFDTAARNTGALRVIGRLKPGVTMAQAQSDADGIAATLREQFPTKKNVDLHFRVKGMHADLVGDVRPLVLALFGAVVFVLLIACANVANLLLVRAAARQREFVIRTAIGGGRWRLVRQLLTETMLLAGLGGALGVALGYAGVNLLASMAPPRLPRLGAIHVDRQRPRLQRRGHHPHRAGLRPGAGAPRLATERRRHRARQHILDSAPAARLRYGVVLTEVALSFVLLAGSGLMIRSFIALQQVDPGYDPSNVLTFFRPAARPTPQERAALSSVR